MIDDVMLEAEDKMDKALQAAKSELATIRTGRANPSMFNGIVREASCWSGVGAP